MMYNKERKETYINFIKDTGILEGGIKYLSLKFEQCSPFEEKLEKDICDWSVTEIINFYQSMISRSLESLLVVNSQYAKYTTWCLENAFVNDSQNHFLEIDREILNKKCVNRGYLISGIVSRHELINLINNENRVKNAYERFIILGIFEGIGGDANNNFQNLTMKNIRRNMIYLPDGRNLRISKELVEYAKQASETYERETYSKTKPQIRPFDLNDERIVKIAGYQKELSYAGFRHKIQMLLDSIKEYNDDLPIFSTSMLFESGRIEMIKNFMKKENIEAIKAIEIHRDEIGKRYSKIHAISRYCDKWSDFLKE